MLDMYEEGQPVKMAKLGLLMTEFTWADTKKQSCVIKNIITARNGSKQ
jgi:hypothetical protein